jgi:YidC/Oxa1 family membrane protein insertase
VKRTYLAQSGLIGSNAPDKSSGRALWATRKKVMNLADVNQLELISLSENAALITSNASRSAQPQCCGKEQLLKKPVVWISSYQIDVSFYLIDSQSVNLERQHVASSSAIAVTIRSTTATGDLLGGARNEEPTKRSMKKISTSKAKKPSGAGLLAAALLRHCLDSVRAALTRYRPCRQPRQLHLSALPAHSGCCRVGMVFYGHETLSPGLER